MASKPTAEQKLEQIKEYLEALRANQKHYDRMVVKLYRDAGTLVVKYGDALDLIAQVVYGD